MNLGEALRKTSPHHSIRCNPISGYQFVSGNKWKRINDISDVYPFNLTISSQHFNLSASSSTFIYNGFGSTYWRHIKGETFDEFLRRAVEELRVDIILDSGISLSSKR